MFLKKKTKRLGGRTLTRLASKRLSLLSSISSRLMFYFSLSSVFRLPSMFSHHPLFFRFASTLFLLEGHTLRRCATHFFYFRLPKPSFYPRHDLNYSLHILQSIRAFPSTVRVHPCRLAQWSLNFSRTTSTSFTNTNEAFSNYQVHPTQSVVRLYKTPSCLD